MKGERPRTGRMPKLLHYSEKMGCGVTMRLDSGEPCLISVAQTGVRVRNTRFGFLGATLYDEKNVYRAAQTAMALHKRFPEWRLPVSLNNPVLRAFANAAWHCPTAAAVVVALGKAQDDARGDQ